MTLPLFPQQIGNFFNLMLFFYDINKNENKKMGYTIVQPSSAQPSYSADSQTDLVFVLPGNILTETLRISGDISFSAATIPCRGQNIMADLQNPRYLTPMIGAHALFSSFSVRRDGAQLEYISNYGAYASQIFGASESTREVMSSSKSMTELRGGNNVYIGGLAVVDSTGANNIYNSKSFSIKPLICLTTVPVVDGNSGQIVIQCRLSPTNNFIVKSAASNSLAATYKNIYCSYETIDDKAMKSVREQIKDMPMTITTTQQVAIRSNREFASINIPIPGVTRGWLGSFLKVNTTADSPDLYDLPNLPGLQRVRLLVDGKDLTIKYPYNLAQPNNLDQANYLALTDPLLLIDLAHETLINSGRIHKMSVSGVFGSRERQLYGNNGIIAQVFDPGLKMDNSSTISVEITSNANGDGSTYFMNMSFISFVKNQLI